MAGNEKTTNIVKLILGPIVYFALSQGASFIYMFIEAFKLGYESAISGQMLSTADMTSKLMDAVAEETMLLTLIGAVIALPVIYFVFYDKKEGKCEKKRAYLWVILLGMGACVVLNMLISISGLPNLSPTYQELSKLIYTGNFFLELATAGIIVPVLEELVFRGILFKRLSFIVKLPWAIIISSVVFGLVHGNLVQFVYATLLGAVMCFVYIRCKNILAPIILHMTANTISVLLSDCKPVAELMEKPVISLLYILICLVFAIIAPIFLLKNTKTEKEANVMQDEIQESEEAQL